jgi:hypothetical protein
MEFEDAAVVKSQAFPHGVTALHRRVERADPGFVAMRQLSVDIHNQVPVSLVEFLKHWRELIRNPGKQETILSSWSELRLVLIS